MQFNFIVPRHNDTNFKTFLEPSLQKLGFNKIFQVKDQPGEPPSTIFKKYNAGIEALFQTGLNDDDICIFVHEDVGIVEPFFVQKMEKLFTDKKDVTVCVDTICMNLVDDGIEPKKEKKK
jgi:hypothetical protein